METNIYCGILKIDPRLVKLDRHLKNPNRILTYQYIYLLGSVVQTNKIFSSTLLEQKSFLISNRNQDFEGLTGTSKNERNSHF